MMQSKVMHGRREGQTKERNSAELHRHQIGLAAQGIDPKNVLVVQPNDWKRIQDNLSRYNREAEMAKQKAAEREHLHEFSKNLVKHWNNTNEGIRLKKLQARKLREEKEEEERKKVDIEEAKLQAQKRKEAIERAKTLQYYQTDRVKEFHGALLLSEVLKERDAQIELKNRKKNWEEEKDKHLYELQQRQVEEQVKLEQEKALERYRSKQANAQFQLLQVQDHVSESVKIKNEDVKEGKSIKEQVEIYEAAKSAIKKQRRADKVKLMETYKKDMHLKELSKQKLAEKEKEEDKEIGRFVDAKKKMIKMRKSKETELFQAFQDHTEKMKEKLHKEMTQKVDDEDSRIAKAVEERERKRLEEEKFKEENTMKTLESIKHHRINTIKEAELENLGQRKKDQDNLKSRVKEDQMYQRSMEKKRQKERERAIAIQKLRIDQMSTKNQKSEVERKEKLDYDVKNLELLVKEEEQFQEYAKKVIAEAEAKERNIFPLVKAASAGPGGGRGPKFEGKGGLRPSYPVSDATGVQLPYYRKDLDTHKKAYGHVGRSQKRIGFTW